MKTIIIEFICLYLIIVNIIAFIMYGYDKKLAMSASWRISEYRLIMIAIAGGSMGAYLGMYCFRHKTRKPRFFIGLPLIVIAQLLIIVFFLGKIN
ncbi:MAG: DUF1294 domain-containing protein [Eubacterium sp.]